MAVELRRENALADAVSQQTIKHDDDYGSSGNKAPTRGQDAETKRLLPIVTAPEPHYFRTNQLTEKPRVLNDVSADLILVLPELPAQVAILRLFINDVGAVDKVVVEDSHLPEGAERRVLDAFAKIGFQPGKIGRIAVRSQLKIEVRTADFSLPLNRAAQGEKPQSGIEN